MSAHFAPKTVRPAKMTMSVQPAKLDSTLMMIWNAKSLKVNILASLGGASSYSSSSDWPSLEVQVTIHICSVRDQEICVRQALERRRNLFGAGKEQRLIPVYVELNSFFSIIKLRFVMDSDII